MIYSIKNTLLLLPRMAVILGISGSCLFMTTACTPDEKGSGENQTASNTTSPNIGLIPTVEVAHPVKREYDSALEITGNLEANQEVTLHAMESGAIRSISKDLGDRVSKNEVIAHLDNPALFQEFKQAEAEIQQTRAKIKLTESTFFRLKKIYEKTPDLITITDLENAEAAYLSATGMADAAIAKKQGLEARLGFLKIRAPFSGIITQRYVDKGALLQSGMNSNNASPVFDIKEISVLRLVLEVPESDLGLVKKGQAVSIDFPELPGETFDAKVSRLANSLNVKSKTMRVEIDLDNAKGKLKPGMFGKIKLPVKNHEGAISVPIMAITAVKNQNFIFKMDGKTVRKIPVSLGMEDKYFIEVLGNDFTVNDRVVTKGKGLISDGSEVIAKLQGGEK